VPAVVVELHTASEPLFDLSAQTVRLGEAVRIALAIYEKGVNEALDRLARDRSA
jgi:hypothetical protein